MISIHEEGKKETHEESLLKECYKCKIGMRCWKCDTAKLIWILRKPKEDLRNAVL